MSPSLFFKTIFIAALAFSKRLNAQEETCVSANCDAFGFRGQANTEKPILLAENHDYNANTEHCIKHLIETLGNSQKTFIYLEGVERGAVTTCPIYYSGTPTCLGWDNVEASKIMLGLLHNSDSSLAKDDYIKQSQLRHLIETELPEIERQAKKMPHGSTDRLKDSQLSRMRQYINSVSDVQFPERSSVLWAIKQVQAWRKKGMSYLEISQKSPKIAATEPPKYRKRDETLFKRALSTRDKSLQLTIQEAIKKPALHLFATGANHSHDTLKDKEIASQISVLWGPGT